MKIQGVPEQVRKSDVMSAVRSLGIDVDRLISMEWLSGALILTVMADGPDGKPYAARNGDHREVMTHKVSVKVVPDGD
jgi:hypothetical protein